MIPRAHITAWRAHAPWSTDAQIEQDLIISRAIVEVFSDPLLSGSLAFRGGTALHKLYLTPPARYSEDIDLVQVEGGPIGDIMIGRVAHVQGRGVARNEASGALSAKQGSGSVRLGRRRLALAAVGLCEDRRVL